jgi:hypothetical protein
MCSDEGANKMLLTSIESGSYGAMNGANIAINKIALIMHNPATARGFLKMLLMMKPLF